MSKILHFSASTSVKNLFGKGLVTDQIAAVFELVKNSYDADAKKVHIVFKNLKSDNPQLVIFDDGTGMDLADIKNRWMIIGTESKKKELYSPIYKRPLNGDKGIGRFSVDRLGEHLSMSAQKRNSSQMFNVEFDWNLFDGEEKDIQKIDIPYTVRENATMKHGVFLKITNLRDYWDEGKVKELYRNLRQFKSPFSKEDNFKIFITAEEYDYKKKEVIVEKLEGVSSLWIDAEIDEKNPKNISIMVNRDGLEYNTNIENKYNFGSVQAKIYAFNQGDKIRFSNRYGLRVREFGNIRLYRDDFRIYPYGEEKDDWLSIDRRQTQKMFSSFGTRDLIGYVQISKLNNIDLKPLTNRQGLEENDAFKHLREFLIDVCLKTLETYHFNKIKKGVNETIKKTKAEMVDAVHGLEEIAKEIKNESPYASKEIRKYTIEIKKQQQNQLRYVQDQDELIKVYSRISQKETILHKLIHQSMIHATDAKMALININDQNLLNDEEKQITTAKKYISEVIELLKTVRDDVVKKRKKTKQNIGRIVRKYINGNKAFFEENGVTVYIKTEGDLTCKVDVGDIKAIVNNLTTNAVKSLKQVSDRERQINIEIYNTDKYYIIRCIDNGIGIKESERERIFDPFQSTTDGFGLGLTIIDEIAKEYSGALELMETKIGACFSVKLRLKNA